jgi:hypothetical protein
MRCCSRRHGGSRSGSCVATTGWSPRTPPCLELACACGVVELKVYGLSFRPLLNRYCDQATIAAAIAAVIRKASQGATSLVPRNP